MSEVASFRTVLFIFVLLISVGPFAYADGDFVPSFSPQLQITRTDRHISIDGKLNSIEWGDAARADGFAEYRPNDGTEPPVKTIAWITYDDENIYVAFYCEDERQAVRATWSERDQISGDDNVGFFIDPYGNAACAYYLNVTPYGGQYDAIWSPAGGEDDSYDLVWESAGRITDSGYQVELALPFSSMRFPAVESQTWKVNFWRNHPREVRRQYSWAAMDRDNSCFVCQFGTVTGIAGVSPGKGIALIPSVVGSQEGQLRDHFDPGSPFDNGKIDGSLALSGKYSVSSDVTVEGSYNPDFSQVESDADQIDVNSTFALSYPEKRPFFQEGSDMFWTWNRTVYTRSINDPLMAAKLTARSGRFSFAYLGARDEHSPVIVPLEERSYFVAADKSTSTILRAKQSFGRDSYVGLFLTDRRFDDGGSGSVLAADGDVRFSRLWKVQWLASVTHTGEPDDSTLFYNTDTFDDGTHTVGFDGESYEGYMYVANLEGRSRHLIFDICYAAKNPTFRTDNGFEPSNSRKWVDMNFGWMFYPNTRVFERVEPYTRAGATWNWDGTIREQYATLELSAAMTGQTSWHPRIRIARETFQGREFNNLWHVHTCFNSRPTGSLYIGGWCNYGDAVAYRYLTIGRELYIGGEIEWRLFNRLRIAPQVDYNRSVAKGSHVVLFDTYVMRTKLTYQYNRELSLRLIVQYNDDGKTWDVDPLLTYQINPFSLFYIGSTYDYCRMDNPSTGGSETSLTDRQFFMKLQYLFQI